MKERRLFRIFEHIPSVLKKHISGERWYGDWKKYVENYDVFIIGNDLRGADLIECNGIIYSVPCN